MEHLGGYQGYPKDTYVVQVVQALYGTKQASRCFNLHADATLRSIGLKPLSTDTCVYVMENPNCPQGLPKLILILYVDDLLAMAPEQESIEE
eukprot:4890780-Ditylum_brightwellii.AAC.1